MTLEANRDGVAQAIYHSVGSHLLGDINNLNDVIEKDWIIRHLNNVDESSYNSW